MVPCLECDHIMKSKYARRTRDKDYMAWIASLPCSVCLTRKKIEVAHVGDHPAYRKCSDRETLPLCRNHHREGPESHHQLGKKFWTLHRIDREKLVLELNVMYELFRLEAA